MATAGWRRARALGVLLVLALIMPAILAPSILASSQVYRGSATGVAVYKGEAYPLHVEVVISPGSGNVSIVGVTYDSLFRLSLVEAVYEAAWITGHDPWSFDYVINVKPALSAVTYYTGPSLSLAVYTAALAALTGSEIRPDAVITGTINPDSTVGFVGYVAEKAQGAENYGYKVFVYPALQDKKYDIVRQTVHVGPYVFSTRAVVSEPQRFEVGNLSLTQVSIAPALLLTLDGSPLPSWTYGDLIFRGTEKVLGNRTRLVQEFCRSLERKVANMIVYAEEALETSGFFVKYPGYAGDVRELLYDAVAHYDAYRSLYERGLYFAASEYLFNAYLYATKAYYTVRFLTFGEYDYLNGLYMDLVSEYRAVERLLQEAGATSDPAGIIMASQAALWLNEARGDLYTAILGIQVIQIGFSNSHALKQRIAFSAAEAMSRIVKSKLYALLALTLRNGLEPDNRLVEDFIDYAHLLYTYALRYSDHTRVYSEIVNKAGNYGWLAVTILSRGNSTLNLLTSLGYALESTAYTQLYFALHPGIKKVAKLRYQALLKTLNLYMASAGEEAPLIAQWLLEKSLLYDDPAAKLLWLEKALVLVKAYIALSDRTGYKMAPPEWVPEINGQPQEEVKVETGPSLVQIVAAVVASTFPLAIAVVRKAQLAGRIRVPRPGMPSRLLPRSYKISRISNEQNISEKH